VVPDGPHRRAVSPPIILLFLSYPSMRSSLSPDAASLLQIVFDLRFVPRPPVEEDEDVLAEQVTFPPCVFAAPLLLCFYLPLTPSLSLLRNIFPSLVACGRRGGSAGFPWRDGRRQRRAPARPPQGTLWFLWGGGVSGLGLFFSNHLASSLPQVFPGVAGKPKVAVRGLSYGLAAGEVFGFLGINGAGKTTTLQMLSGDVMPSSGTAKLAGCDTSLFPLCLSLLPPPPPTHTHTPAARVHTFSLGHRHHHKQTHLLPPCHHRHRLRQLVLTLF
jgi:ABC-type multidrug transport system fused ATPase/permease subunit